MNDRPRVLVKEKIADYVDPPRVMPLVGPVQLHHAHYKCTVYYTELVRVGWPVPHTLEDEDAGALAAAHHRYQEILQVPRKHLPEDLRNDLAESFPGLLPSTLQTLKESAL